jgi:hypothetical protein
MPDTKITALTALTAADPANDMMPIVDVSDTSMAASGTTKRISINNILACSPSATLASATITGDLTVDTSVFKVNTTTDQVGIGTATPTASTRLDVVGGTFARFNKGAANQYHLRIGNSSKDYGLYVDIDNNGTNGFSLYDITASADVLRYVPGASGSWTHYINGTTAMTLNSTGLGVGVTPSAWNATYNVLDIGQNGSISGRTSTNNTIDIVSNGFRNSGGTWVYKLATSSAAARYQVDGGSGAHLWYIGVAGTAGNTIAGFSTASMTLDSAGNLIWSPSATPPTLVTNGNLTVNATSNTNLRFSYRGSDGTTRVANITLA